MRGVTAVLVLVLAACSTAGEDTTTTTAPLAEPLTTTTTAATATTTTEGTTTTTVEECVERDGALRNRRGFICPPHLAPFGETVGYLPGHYETQILRPSLGFSLPGRMRSPGEARSVLPFCDADTNCIPAVMFWTGDNARTFQSLDYPDAVFVSNLTTTETRLGGIPATRLDFEVERDPCPDEFTAGAPCFVIRVPEPPPGNAQWAFQPGGRFVLIHVSEIDPPLTVFIEASTVTFDTYWTEVAQPILDSIEFLDP